MKVIHSQYLVQVYDPQTSTHSRCLRWWCCFDSPGLQPSLLLASIGCSALTLILGKSNTSRVELEFRWLARPVESITLFGLGKSSLLWLCVEGRPPADTLFEKFWCIHLDLSTFSFRHDITSVVSDRWGMPWIMSCLYFFTLWSFHHSGTGRSLSRLSETLWSKFLQLSWSTWCKL